MFLSTREGLASQRMVVRQPGTENLGWLDELTY
jgi:hypothetical protein